MDGKRLIEKIRLRNILSFGDKGEEITLEPLNIIIGQNASGKSNLVDVIKLLRSLKQDKGLATFISKTGGIGEWIWKGKNKALAEVEIIIDNYADILGYELKFTESYQKLDIKEETFAFNGNKSALVQKDVEMELPVFPRLIAWDKEEINEAHYFLSERFSSFKAYTDLQTNRGAEIRRPQVPDIPNEFLEEDASNLALVLNDLEHRGNTKDKIVENLKKFNPRIKDYSIRILGGTVQLFIREEGLEKPISAMRLSDGTLRYLCLLAILCHPEPPPLICIEEPETGLHPDILPTIAELMIDASKRTQLIVTTHSDILVSAFSEHPEAILVCEKDEDGTHFKRLNEEELKVWMEEYNDLGEVWLRGGIGGTRW